MKQNEEKREAMAQLLAEDVAPGLASKQAGYVDHAKKRALEQAERPDMVARVAAIRRAKAREASDVTPMIDALMTAAELVSDLKTPAGLTAIRGLLVEAARLKGMAPPPAALQPLQPRRHMTDEEWMETFAPKPGTEP